MPEPIDPSELSGYRPLPGRGTVDFIDPSTGEHFPGTWWYNPEVFGENRIVSRYRLQQAARGMTPAERAEMGEARRRRTRGATARSAAYFRRREVQGQEQAPLEDTMEMRDLLLQRDVYAWWARQYPYGSPEREALLAPRGPLARTLAALGFRPPNAPWTVGTSDEVQLAQWRSTGSWRTAS
jgi:hypothetical protein